jgi:wobble nucleotide-excising tRNase
MVNNSTNINKTKESLNSDGQQFLQYQQNQKKVYQREMVNNSSNIKKTKESISKRDGQQFYQYQENKRKFKL